MVHVNNVLFVNICDCFHFFFILLRDIKVKCKLPDHFPPHTSYSAEEVQALLWDSESLLGPDWILVYINVMENFSSFPAQ